MQPFTDNRELDKWGAAEHAVLPAPGTSFSHLPFALRHKCLALHLRGRHIPYIQDMLNRCNQSVSLAALEAGVKSSLQAVQAWRRRALPPQCAIVFYEQIPARWGGHAAIPLWAAIGITPGGHRLVLGLWPEQPSPTFWRDIQRDLCQRGLGHIALAITDRPGPMEPAIAAAFPAARIIAEPVRPLARLLREQPKAVAARLLRGLKTAAEVELPPRAGAIIAMLARHLPPSVSLEDFNGGLQGFLDLPLALRRFILRGQSIDAVRQKLQRNTACLPAENDGEIRAILMTDLLRGIDRGWKVKLGDWRPVHEALAALLPMPRRARLHRQRVKAQQIGHADQFHQ